MCELKPCKYCGGKPEFNKLVALDDDSFDYEISVLCTNCNYETKPIKYATKRAEVVQFDHPEKLKEAAHIWNKEMEDLRKLKKLNPCPFCKKDVVRILVFDDEGNCKGEPGCEYESDPWSGLAYGLYHADTDCLLRTTDECMGGLLYDTAEEAAEAWNEGAG